MPNNTKNWSNILSKWIDGTFSETIECTPLDLQMLEDRVLYSAGPLPVDLVSQTDAVHAEFIQTDLDGNDVFDSVESQFDFISLALDTYEIGDLDQVYSAETDSAFEAGQELIIVDTSVEGYQQLVDDLTTKQMNDRNSEVVYLDSRTDGVRQISDFLNKRSNLDAIHLISHGSDGALGLGSAQLDLSSLASYQEEISSWQRALAEDADLLIYGCNVAESADGEQFVDQLSVLLQVDVSASDDATGDLSLGGDWTFEYQVGEVEASMVFSTSIQSDWFGTLALRDSTSEDAVSPGSASRAIAVDHEGRVTQVFTSDLLPGSNGNDIYMIQFDVDGSQLGPAQKVNTGDDVGDQHNASIAMNDDGDYVVAWTSDDLVGNVTVKGKIFSTTAPAVEFEVGDQSALQGGPITLPPPVLPGEATLSAITDAYNASVSMNASGDFIVAWEGSGFEDTDGIYAQRFQLDGTAIDDMAFLVNGTILAGYQGSPDVAINSTGEFIVGWDTTTSDTVAGDGHIAVYDADLNELISDYAEFSFASTYFANLTVDIDDSLNLAVAATNDATFDLPGVVSKNIVLVSFEYDGIGGWVNSSWVTPHDIAGTMGDQFNPSVAIVDNEIIVAWEGEQTSGTDIFGVYFAAYNLDLTSQLQPETHVTTAIGPLQTSPSITSFHDGREWAIGWLDSTLGYQNLIGNDLPNGNDGTVNINQFDSYTFSKSDFGYQDDNGYYPDNDPFTSIEITALPDEGELVYQGSEVEINDVLLVSEIEAGELEYIPEFGFVGTDTGLSFIVSDGFESATTANSLDLDVASLANAMPTNLSSGVQFNTDGGNDAYFLTQDTGFLNGLDDFTVEVSFASLSADSAALISYQTTDFPDASLYHNDFLIQYNAVGTMTVFLPGGAGGSDIANLSGMDYSTLMDGSQHSIAFSFKSSTGEWKLFVDGSITDQGTSTLFQNSTLSSGGALVIGQEQDSPNADFDPDLAFSGTIFDVRVWDDDFKSTDDFLFLDQKIDSANLPDELLAAWQFEGLVSGTDVVNIVDPGNPLVVNHIGEAGFSASNPQTTLSLLENAANGTIVGTVIPTDINLPETFLFSLDNDAGGRFDIDSSSGEITVADGSQLNFEADTFHSIDVQVTDGGGLQYTQSIVINLVDVNEAPTFGPNIPATVDEGSTGNVIDDSNLKETDPDDDGAELTYTLTNDVAFGVLRLDGTLLEVNDTFTQADVIDGKLTYDHDGTDAGVNPTDSFGFTLEDGGEDGVPVGVGSFTINVNPINEPPVANDDSFSTPEDTVHSTGNLLANDTDEDGDGLLVVEYSQPANGTVALNPDGSFTYTPNSNFNGIDTFDYTMIQSQNGLVHHWGMNGDGVDLIGGNTSNVDGATPIPSENGTGLQFDEVDDFVEISGVELDSNFTISFDFKIDSNGGGQFQYLYSQGAIQTSNSLNIYFGESGSGAPGILKTAIFDGNDPTNNATRNALNIDINSLIGDSNWHEYSLVVEQGVGVKVFIDGVELASSTHAEDAAVINQDIYLGKRSDNNVNRFFGGALDSLQIFDQALSEYQISDPSNGLFTATATVTVDPENDIPVAHDNIYGVSVGGTINVGLERGLLYNDSDVDGDVISVTAITTPPTNGTLTFGTDGTFSYTHTASNTDPDSFEYQISDGNGGFETATVHIHVDDQGLTSTNEFLVNDSSPANQNTHQGNGSSSDSAVATAANGDYVVTWTSYSGGQENVLLQRYDFNGNRVGLVIDVSADLADGDNHHASTSMADDGRFVVVWSNQYTTASNDGTDGSVYFQLFNTDGTTNGPTTRVTDAAFSAGEQVSPDVSMNASGQFAITWDGEGDGGIHNVFLNMYEANGVSITGGPQKMNLPGVGGGLEYNASVVMSNDGMVFAVWDDGNVLHGKVFDQFGNPGPEFVPSEIPDVVDVSRSSLDISDTGLLAVAYQIEVDDGIGGTNWESRLQILDMSNPVLILNPDGNQTFSGNQTNPSVSFGDDGTLIMTWEGEGPGDTSGIFARQFKIEFNSDGAPYAEALGDEFRVNQTTSGGQRGASVSAIDSENFVVVWSGQGIGDSNGVFARQFGNQTEFSLSGQVVLDVNGDSDLTDAEDVVGADVYLYRDGGDGVISADDILIRGATQTDGSGNYSFTGLEHDTTYWVVVDSKSISGSLGTGYVDGDIWAEQTYGDGGSKFGGLTAGVSDNAATLLTAQHVSQVNLGNSNYTNVDFGFSFNVVTNTLGGNADDDDLLNDRTIQGTLRQFIANANAIVGANEMRFVPGVAATESDGSDSWWEIAVSQALPAILGHETAIDGRAYDSADGITLLNSNTMVHTSVTGADGITGTGDETVGVGADGVYGTGDEMILSGVDGPDLEIHDILGVNIGLEVFGAQVEISNLAIHGFGQSGINSGNIFVRSTADSVYIHDNVIGSEAGDYSIPPTSAFSVHGITVRRADDGIIEDNLIAFHAESGIRFVGTNDGTDNVEGWTVRGNEIFQNALEADYRSGIDILRAEGMLISGNFIAANSGFGIDTYDSVGDITISDNTIAGNGTSAARSGIRLFGNDNVVEHNIVAGNNGAGVNIVSDYVDGLRSFVASTDNLVSQNSFFNNSGVAIDQMSQFGDAVDFNRGDGVSDNTTASDLNAGNDGVDHPVLTEAYIDGTGLNVFGSLDTLANFDRVELYLGNPGVGDSWLGVNYGEGEIYLGSIDLGDFVTLSVSGEFHAILDPPPGGWPTQLTSGGTVTTIGIQSSGNTSEFSNVVLNNDIPDAVASAVTLDEDETHVFQVLDFQFEDNDDANFDHIIIDSLASEGTLLLAGTAIDPTNLPLTISRTDLNSGVLTFAPDLDANGSAYANFTFRVSDGTSIGASATMTIHVDSINDVPVANDDTYSTPEDTLLNAMSGVLDNDFDADHSDADLNASVVAGPAHGEVTMKRDGTFRYTPDDDFFGIDTFKYRVVDKAGGFDEAVVTINILPVNDAPEFHDLTPKTVFVQENRSNVIQFVASDAESDPMAFSLASGMSDDNSLFAIHPTSGKLVFRSAPDFENPGGISGNGTYDVNVKVTDKHGDSSIHSLEVKLLNVNESPIANDDFLSVDEGAAAVIDVTANDTDPDDDFKRKFTTVNIVSGPANGHAFVNSLGNIVYVHNGDEIFTDNFTYEIVDKTGLSDTATVFVGINPVEDPTQTHNDFLGRVQVGEQLVVSAEFLLANDIDDDSVLTYNDIVLLSQPDNGHVEIVDGELIFTPDEESPLGLVSFEYQVVSNGVTSDSANAVVLVTPPSVVSTPEESEPEAEEESPADPPEDTSSPPETNSQPGLNPDPTDDSTSVIGSADNMNFAAYDDETRLQTSLETNEFKVSYAGATYAYASRFDDLSLANLAGVWVSKATVEVSQFETTMLAGLIWDDYDTTRNELMPNKLQLGVSEIAASAASFLTVGYLAWIIRGGVLLTTFMSSLPAWSSFDILSVLETDENESIEQMVDL